MKISKNYIAFIVLFLSLAVQSQIVQSQTKDNLLTWNLTRINLGEVGLLYQRTTNDKNALGILIQHSFNHEDRYTSFYIGDFYYFRRTYDSFCLSPMLGVEYLIKDEYTLPILLGISYRWLFFKTFSLSVGMAIGPGFQMFGGSCERVGLSVNSLFDVGVAF